MPTAERSPGVSSSALFLTPLGACSAMWPEADLPRTPWPDFPPRWASAWGDDRFGLYAELRVGNVVQRLRWIEPGSFWMGSTTEERDRLDDDLKKYAGNEGPRHRVSLTVGYWLADTPCTQGLWQAVMGNNPSDFKNERDSTQRPVDQVGWDWVQEFLKMLSRKLPVGCEVVLPTEAQWEYAARAGSESAYWWGEKPDSGKANWGNEREGTTAVKSYLANGWGLYDVHGNVWEWCAGSMRDYGEGEEIDPPDGQEQDWRALRGGSWIDGAGWVRCAFRFDVPRSSRTRRVGFRFVLSTSPALVGSGAADRPEGEGIGGPGRPDALRGAAPKFKR